MFSTYELCKLQIERADDRENLVVLDLRLMEAAENGLAEHRGDSEGIFLRFGQTTPFGFDLCLPEILQGRNLFSKTQL